MKPIDFSNFPNLWDESFLGLTDQDRALLKRAPTTGEMQDLTVRRAFRYFLAKTKEKSAQAITDCFSFKPLPDWIHDRTSYYMGVVTALRYVLDMPRELYDAAQMAEAQTEEPEEVAREEIFGSESTPQSGA